MKTAFEYSQKFKSSLDEVVIQVGRIILQLDDHLQNYNRFVLDLVLRETLNNAVIHGNGNDPEKYVKLSLGIVAEDFVIVVEDQGSGFEWQQVIHGEAKPYEDHGRGYPIFQSYCSHIHLNNKGNQITLTLPMNKQ